MKLALLLAQYLYANKKLDLPGIGTFHLDPSIVIDPDNDKNNKKEVTDGIRFDYDTSIKENTDLTDFIAAKTGKIKALAAADLDSHLWLGQQFLHIGKPFVLEGIGQLVKTQSGKLDFSAGILQPEILKDQSGHQQLADHSSQEGEHDYKDLLNPRKDKMEWKKPVAFLLIIAGLVVAVWGGYTIYKKNNPSVSSDSRQKENAAPVNKPENPSVTPPVTVPGPGPAPTAVNAVTPAGSYKFVVETAGKQRALARYQKLKNLPTDVRIQTTDSLNFKLYFLVNASPADTAKILDSLRTYYTPKWSKAFIEQ